MLKIPTQSGQEDDGFLFCMANTKEINTLKYIMDSYKSASGQAINYQKSTISFSRNTDPSYRSTITSLLGVREVISQGKYLGFPSMVRRNKKAIFIYLKEQIWKNIQNWSQRSLFRAGKEVLIKSVAQVIPSYCMSDFLLPTSFGEEIERMLNSFYSGSKKNGAFGINWLKWDNVILCFWT